MSEFKTAKGTVMPFRNMHGKKYLEVKYRVIWCREEHPNWSFETKFLSLDKDQAIAQATIRDEKGAIMAMGHKSETKLGFPDFMEKAETGAIGRALSFCGYGTDSADLDEGERIVDSPSEVRTENPVKAQIQQSEDQDFPFEDKTSALAEYVIPLGTNEGKKLRELSVNSLRGYSQLKKERLAQGKKLEGKLAEACDKAEQYLNKIGPGLEG